MEQVLNKNNNINLSKQIISNEQKREKSTYTKINKVIRKLYIQIIFCSVLITAIYLYKTYYYTSFEYINNKYGWVIKWNMTYENIHNNIANYLNSKFQFKIPLKENNSKEQIIENSEYVNNNVEMYEKNNVLENEEEQVLTNNESEGAVLASVGYDNMRVIADEIKANYHWIMPTSGTVSSPFGVRDPSRPDISTFHMGIDLANSEGTEIFAAIDGEIIESTYNSVYGNYIKIAKDDVITIYAHCSNLIAKKGEKIMAGEKIALMGSTGIATGSHLHFEIRKNGQVINPEYILNFR